MLSLWHAQAAAALSFEESCTRIQDMVALGTQLRPCDLQDTLASVPSDMLPAVLQAHHPATGRNALEDALVTGPRHAVPTLIEAGARASLAALAAEPATDPRNGQAFPAGTLTTAIRRAIAPAGYSEAAQFVLSLCRADSSPPETGARGLLGLVRAVASLAADPLGPRGIRHDRVGVFRDLLQFIRLGVPEPGRRPAGADVVAAAEEEIAQMGGRPVDPAEWGEMEDHLLLLFGHAVAYAEEQQPGCAATAAARFDAALAANRYHAFLRESWLGTAITGVRERLSAAAGARLPAPPPGGRKKRPMRGSWEATLDAARRIAAENPSHLAQLRAADSLWQESVSARLGCAAGDVGLRGADISAGILAAAVRGISRESIVSAAAQSAVAAIEAALVLGPIGGGGDSDGAEEEPPAERPARRRRLACAAASAAGSPPQQPPSAAGAATDGSRRRAKLQYAAVVCTGRWGELLREPLPMLREAKAVAQREESLRAALASLRRIAEDLGFEKAAIDRHCGPPVPRAVGLGAAAAQGEDEGIDAGPAGAAAEQGQAAEEGQQVGRGGGRRAGAGQRGSGAYMPLRKGRRLSRVAPAGEEAAVLASDKEAGAAAAWWCSVQ